MLIGYARTSTQDQKYSLEAQKEKLAAAGCEKHFAEEVSSVDSKRLELENALDYIREGDILVVTKLDRLARSVADTVEIQKQLAAKNAGLKILDMEIDTSRQKVGIAKAKADGKYTGRQPTSDDKKQKILNLAATKTMTREEIAKKEKVSLATVYRVLKEAKGQEV